MPSSVIRRFSFDSDLRNLDIEFVSGRRYRYHAVPPRVAEAMRAARSKGSYFNRKVRDRFRFTRLEDEDAQPAS